MKRLVTFLLIFFSFSSFAQTYVFDTTFGDDGSKRFGGNAFQPKKGLLINNNYYFISGNKIGKVNYNGQIVSNFGVNGFVSLGSTNETVGISNFIYQNNFFYLYGSVTNSSTNNKDIYIIKINENGNYDSSFGNGGVAKIDLGQNEFVSDLIVESNGSLFCTGSKKNPYVYDTDRLIYFKINVNGGIDTGFDPNGYKEYLEGIHTTGFSILDYNNKKLLVGTTFLNESGIHHPKLLIVSVNSDGSVNTAFGNNGSKTVSLGGGNFVSNLRDIQLFNSKLYVNYHYAESSSYAFSKFLITDLVTDLSSNISVGAEYSDFKVSSEGIYSTKWCSSCCIAQPPSDCSNTFNVSKRNLDGTIDTNFHINGLYSYEFIYSTTPHVANYGDSRSYVVIKEADGKILIAGYVYAPYGPEGFSMLRLVNGTLNINEIDPNNVIALYPNPFVNKISFASDKSIKDVEVYDLAGRKIATPTYNFDGNATEIDLSSITETGTYMIKLVTQDNESILRRVIKK